MASDCSGFLLQQGELAVAQIKSPLCHRKLRVYPEGSEIFRFQSFINHQKTLALHRYSPEPGMMR